MGQNECNHGVTFDAEEARRILGDLVSEIERGFRDGEPGVGRGQTPMASTLRPVSARVRLQRDLLRERGTLRGGGLVTVTIAPTPTEVATLRAGKCPACGATVKRERGAFFARGVGPMSGLVCSSDACATGGARGSLWDDPDNSFMEAVRNRTPPTPCATCNDEGWPGGPCPGCG